MSRVSKGSGSGSTLGISTTAAGVAVLPNTGNNKIMFAVAIVCIVIGLTVVFTTIARSILKRAKK